MRNLYSKIPAMIAVVLTLSAVYVRVIDYTTYLYKHGSLPLYGDQAGETAVVIALLLFALDAVFSLIQLVRGRHPVENAFTILLFIGVFFAEGYSHRLIPNVANETLHYFLRMNFLLGVTVLLLPPQLASLLQHRKSRRAGRGDGGLAPRIARYMETIYSKAPAAIATALAVVCLFILASAFVMRRSEPVGGCFAPPSFSRFETGFAVGAWAGFFFAVDALFSVVKLFSGRRPVFCGLSALAIFLMIPIPHYLPYRIAQASALMVVFVLLVLLEVLSVLLLVRDKKRAVAITDTP